MYQNYPEHIINRLKDREDMEYEDKSKDEYFQNLPPKTVLKELLEWEGICGYTNMILELIKDIYKVQLKQDYDELSKADFVQGLGNIFAAQGIDDVSAMRMDDHEQVTVYFVGGGTKRANCIGDSKRAVISDILKQAF